MTSPQKATLQLYRNFLGVARQWPKDKLRPEFQFSDALRAATHRAFLRNPPQLSQLPDRQAEAVDASSKLRIEGVYTPRTESQNAKGHRWVELQKIDDEKILEGGKNLRTLTEKEYDYAKRSLASLQHILQNRPSTKFPTPNELINPPSMPNYYSRVRDHIAHAEEGKPMPQFSLQQKIKIFMGYKPHQV